MHFFKLILISLMLAACVKPQNHDSNVDKAATFYVDEVKPAMDTAETYDGFTIPKARTYTFTACAKDRRTDEALPGAPFVISGGERDQDIHTDKDGCAVWSERIDFDYLSNEKYIPITRQITAKGTQEGSRTMKLAIDPWALNSKAKIMYDLDHHPDVPQAQLAQDDRALKTMGATERKLFIGSLPIKNAALATNDGTNARTITVYLDPSMSLTDIENAPVTVPVGVASGKLTVEASLIESVTNGGQETKTVISRTEKPVPVIVENGKTSAQLQLTVRQGTPASRYFLAIKVSPVGGPKGLAPFEGLFTIGDMKSILEEGSSTSDLKASNADNTFSYDASNANAAPMSVETMNNLAHNGDRITNAGNGTALKTYSISQLQPSWSAKFELSATRRQVMYSVQACIDDLSNGGRTADGEDFEVKRLDGKWKSYRAGSIGGLHGCITWEDSIVHDYYEPEHYIVETVTIRHKSGYQETRQYALDPWQNFRFFSDPAVKPDSITLVNQTAYSKPDYMVPDSVEISTQNQPRYQLNDDLSMTYIKQVGVRIPIRVARPSDFVDSVMPLEGLRQGKYLLKATYVSPQIGIDGKLHMLISPMIGFWTVTDSVGGFIKTNVEFPVKDPHLLEQRSYLVFEVYMLDDTKLPKNNLSLKGVRDPMAYVDRTSHMQDSTFATVLNMKLQGDSTGVIWNTADLGQQGGFTDSIQALWTSNQIGQTVSKMIMPLAGKTVDQLNAQAYKDAKMQVAQARQASDVGLVARRANADFAFMLHGAEIVGHHPGLASINTFLPQPQAGAYAALLGKLGLPVNAAGDSLMNQAVFADKQGVPLEMATRLCSYFFDAQPRAKVSGGVWTLVEGVWPMKTWAQACIDQVKSGGPTTALSFDHRVHVLQTAGATFKPSHTDMQMKTASSFGFSQIASATDGVGGAWGTGGATSVLTGAMQKQGGLMHVFGSFLGGLGLEMSHSYSTSTMTSGGLAFELGHGYLVQQTDAAIHVTQSERCMIVRPNPNFFLQGQSWMHYKILAHEIGEDQADTLMGRGLMVCTGVVDSRPFDAHETYFTMNTSNQGGSSDDPLDARNLHWLIQLRGQRDFASFLVVGSTVNQSVSQDNGPMSIGDLPNQYMQQAYDKYYAGKMSTMPGFITLEPRLEYGSRPTK